MPGPSKKGEFQFINISNAEESRSDDFLWKVRSHIAKNHVYINKPRNRPRNFSKKSTEDKNDDKSAQAAKKKFKGSGASKKAVSDTKGSTGAPWLNIPICTNPACKDTARHLVTACDARYLRELSPQSTLNLIERLRPNSTLDPFNTLPCESTVYTHKAILGAHAMVRDRFHSYNTWLVRSLADRSMLSGLILCVMTSILMNKTHPDFPIDIVLSQKATALQNLNMVLRDTRRNSTDDVVYLVITMAEHEASLRNPYTYSCHVEGLRRIMELRSRPGAEPIGPMLVRAAGWMIAIHIHFLVLDPAYADPPSPSRSFQHPFSSSPRFEKPREMKLSPSPQLLNQRTCSSQRLLHTIKGTIFVMNSVLKHCAKDYRGAWRLMLDLEDAVEACHGATARLKDNETAREAYFRVIGTRTQFADDLTLLIAADSAAYSASPGSGFLSPRKMVHDDVPTIPLAVFECAKIGIECVIAALETVFQPDALPSSSYFIRAQALQWLEQPYFDELIGFPFRMVKDFSLTAASFEMFGQGVEAEPGSESVSSDSVSELVILPRS